MTLPTYAEFEAAAHAQGFDEVLERVWGPNLELQTHSHRFAVSALVTQGDLWLSCGGQTRHLQAGDRFELQHEEPHAERYGPQGAVFWVARRNPAA
jgi:AraC-like ligand binding domain